MKPLLADRRRLYWADAARVFGVLPLLFALLIAQNSRDLQAVELSLWGLSGWQATTAGILGSGLVWWLLNVLSARLLRRTGERGARWLDQATTFLGLLLFAAWCHALQWANYSSWSSVHLLPYLAVIAIAWRSSSLVACYGHRRAARHALSNRIRFGLLPVLVAIALFDVVQMWLLEPLLQQTSGSSGWTATLIVVAALVAMPIIVLSALPPIVARLWRARPMPPGPERDLLIQGCQKAGISVNQFWHWPSAGGHFYNAAVMGLIPQTRYVLFSADLIRDLPPEQLTAVLGHELGHIKHRHLPFYLLYLLTGTLWVSVASEPLTVIIMGMGIHDHQIATGIALVALFILVLRVGFGIVSRNCERQADLAGANLVGSTQVMQQALANVAALSGQDPSTPSWRHYSISERIDYLASVEKEPQRAEEHHRKVRMLGWTIIAILVMIPFFSLQMLEGGAPSEQWLEDHPVATAAYEQARAGDSTTLRQWLESAEPSDRSTMAWMVYEATAGVTDIRELHAMRHLMLAFIDIDVNNPRLHAMLLNNGSYAVIGGTAHPDSDEIKRTWEALPDLRQAAYNEQSPIYHDTVGCIYFVNQARELAREHFALALELLDAGHWDARQGDSEPFRALLEKRLQAIDEPGSLLPLEYERDESASDDSQDNGDRSDQANGLVTEQAAAESDTAAPNAPDLDAIP